MQKLYIILGVLLMLIASGCELGERRDNVWSTMYCLQGTMRNGEQVREGSVAVNSSEYDRYKGTHWLVLSGPHKGRIFVVRDMGPRARFDMWTSSCTEARNYGARHIDVVQIIP
jgi:hypothetical protein